MKIEELSKIYKQKYHKSIANNLQDIKEYNESSPQETENLLSLYQLRNDFYKEQKGKDNPQFKVLINALQSFKESKVIMHVLKVNEQPHMILTNLDYTEVIGKL